MSCTSIPVDLRPYKRFEALSPSDSTVYDPPTDAVFIPAGFGTGTLYVTGSDDVEVGMSLTTAQSGTILPLSTKKFSTSNAASVIGLWRD